MPVDSNLYKIEEIPHSLYVKIQAVYDSLKTAEKKACEYILLSSDTLSQASIVEAAQYADCSEATWFRLAKRLGYKGYPELRNHLSEFTHSEDTKLYEDISKGDSTEEIIVKVFRSTISALEDTLKIMDKSEYEKAIGYILNAGKIMFCGVGDSHAVAISGMQKFLRIGMNVTAPDDVDVQLVTLANFEKDDVLIPISYSGKTKSILDVVKFAKINGAKIISITNYPVSPLAKISDSLLLTAAFAKHSKGEIISKRITQLCLIESLFVGILTKEDEKYQEALSNTNAALQLNKT